VVLVLTACLEAPNCHTFNVWGFTDRYSWIPDAIPGFGAATLMDEDLQPKPAFDAVLSTLEG
jgi:endo-1,4-beta-xylanase